MARKLSAILALAAVAFFGTTCFGQASTSISLSNGVELQVAASFGHPTGQATLKAAMTPASGNSFYRIFRDQNGLAVFAYEFTVSVGEGGQSLGIAIQPAGTDFAQKFPNADAGKPVPTFPKARHLSISFGNSAALSVFQMEGLGLDVVDTFTAKESGNPSALNQQPANSDRMQLSGPDLRINGNTIAEGGPRGAVEGRYIMLYIPGRGAIILSASPVPDRPFVNAGTISGNLMNFTLGNTFYHLATDAPILARSSSSAVWAYRDPDYRPEGNWTQDLHGNAPKPADQTFFVAASDSLSWWLRN
ncbi:MAG TPA: hypothetical protein VFW83_08190 [Bryobacteraceae bacterium]|nr:hypothetical protein [Bryobacteraceae bacterium]